MKKINKMAPNTGRFYREDDSVVNIADAIVPSGAVLGEASQEWAPTSPNSAKEATVAVASGVRYPRLEITNTSSETDLTVEVYEVDEENNYFIDWFVIPKKQTRANGITVEAHTRYLPRLGGGDVKLVISNDTAITTAFNVTVTIREV